MKHAQQTELMAPQPITTPLAPAPSNALAVRDPESLLRFAIEKGADVGTIERVMTVRRELMQENAKAAFDRDMAAFQAECPVIEKRKAGAKNAYYYAPLDDIVAQVRDLIRNHGFSYSVTAEVDQGWLKAICLITHEAGHSRPSEFKVPIDSKNPMMSDPQRYGGAMTFAKRYAFCNAFGILTSDEDTDGAAKPKPQGPSSIHGSKAPTYEEGLAKKKIIAMTRSVHRCKGDALDQGGNDLLTQWLVDETLIRDDQTFVDLSGPELLALAAKVERKLNP